MKKLVSLIVGLALCLGLTSFAFAEGVAPVASEQLDAIETALYGTHQSSSIMERMERLKTMPQLQNYGVSRQIKVMHQDNYILECAMRMVWVLTRIVKRPFVGTRNLPSRGMSQLNIISAVAMSMVRA